MTKQFLEYHDSRSWTMITFYETWNDEKIANKQYHYYAAEIFYIKNNLRILFERHCFVTIVDF